MEKKEFKIVFGDKTGATINRTEKGWEINYTKEGKEMCKEMCKDMKGCC